MIEIIGICAGFFGLIGYLPQAIKTIKTQKTDDLSLHTFAILFMSSSLWVVYGIAINKPVLWIPSAVVSTSCTIITTIKLKNDLKKPKNSQQNTR